MASDTSSSGSNSNRRWQQLPLSSTASVAASTSFQQLAAVAEMVTASLSASISSPSQPSAASQLVDFESHLAGLPALARDAKLATTSGATAAASSSVSAPLPMDWRNLHLMLR